MLFAEVSPEIYCALSGDGTRMLSRQTVLHMGKWPHPKAPGGVLDITEKRLDEIVKNFNARVGLAGPEMPAHIGHTEHVDDRAVAWAKIEKVADAARPGCHKLVAISEHTDPRAFQDIKNKSYRFVSPTLVFGYKDKTTGKTHDTVMRNFAYTNYPFLQGMGDAEVVNMSEVQLAELTDVGVGSDEITLADGEAALADYVALADLMPDGSDPTAVLKSHMGPEDYHVLHALARHALTHTSVMPTAAIHAHVNAAMPGGADIVKVRKALGRLNGIGHVRYTAYPYYAHITQQGRDALVAHIKADPENAIRLGGDYVALAGNSPPSAGNAASAGSGTLDATGGGAAGNPNLANLPAGYDLPSLPAQCSTCARLGNDCPFAAGDAGVDLGLKQAAAQAGNCPQYVESDGNQPGGGGSLDAANTSPANNRGQKSGGAVTMRDNSLNGSAEFGVIPLSDSGVLSGDESRVLKTLIKLGPGQNRSDIASECAPTGSNPVPKLDSTLFGLVATGHVNREGTLPPNHTWSITPKGTAAYRAHLRRPGGVSLGEISLGESGVDFGVVPLSYRTDAPA